MDAVLYMAEMVDPTIEEFAKNPASRRHAFIACLVTFHCIDYLAHPRKPGNIRRRFRRESAEFAIVDRVAHAFKHVESGNERSPDNRLLKARAVFARPPGRAGVGQAGISRSGDPDGGVEIWGGNASDLLYVVKKAAEFLRGKCAEMTDDDRE
jgi:hypothetical protein